MRCPKCGYLGFEATDRCRNCGYDFSLSSPLSTGELPLRPSSAEGPLEDLELGGSAPAAPAGVDTEASGFGRRVPRQPVAGPVSAAAALPAPAVVAPADAAPIGSDSAEDLPLFAPRPAGTPLAVRRPGAEVPRARRTTTRPMRVEEPVLLSLPRSRQKRRRRPPPAGAPPERPPPKRPASRPGLSRRSWTPPCSSGSTRRCSGSR